MSLNWLLRMLMVVAAVANVGGGGGGGGSWLWLGVFHMVHSRYSFDLSTITIAELEADQAGDVTMKITKRVSPSSASQHFVFSAKCGVS
jgi:hypothetical protein